MQHLLTMQGCHTEEEMSRQVSAHPKTPVILEKLVFSCNLHCIDNAVVAFSLCFRLISTERTGNDVKMHIIPLAGLTVRFSPLC